MRHNARRLDPLWIAALEAWLVAIEEIEAANARRPADEEINRLLAHGIRRVLGLPLHRFHIGARGALQ